MWIKHSSLQGIDGQAYALQAYCLHIGANLGVGGQVVNQNCIQCPFHGWIYSGKTGQCIDNDGKALELQSFQYNDDFCSKDGKIDWKTQKNKQRAKLRKFPLIQINRHINIWIHALSQYQQKPLYPIVNLQTLMDVLQYRGTAEHHVMCHMQDIAQNGADSLHFKYVHRYLKPSIKILQFKWDIKWMTGDNPDIDSLFRHKSSFVNDFRQKIYKKIIQPYPKKEKLSLGSLDFYIKLPIFGNLFIINSTIIQVGISVVYIILKTPVNVLVFTHYVQPQGKAFQKVFHDTYISWYMPYWVSMISCLLQAGQVTNDLYIWQAKRFARKVYIKEDRQSDQQLKEWRTWASQHYEGCSKQQNSLNW